MSLCVNIQKSFDGFALDVNFEAENGVVGLLGASGCGKSMTLKCVAGIVRPDRGQIVADGVTLFDSERKIDLPPQKRRVGLLFQNYALFPNMTVERNILSVLPKTLKNQDRAARFSSLAEKFHIRGLEGHYPAQLSGGQQQRAALARIMAAGPSVLMLDEPLSALDSHLRWQLEGELLNFLEEFGGTTLYVSHNRDEVYRLCGRVCVMNAGRSERLRTTGELFESPDTLASSLLSGCKNHTRAEKLSGRSIRALDWGVDLACGAVPDGVRYAGARAHHVALLGEGETEGENVFACRVTRVVQELFSTVVSLETPAPPGTGEFSGIRAEFPKRKDIPGRGDIVFVRIDPEHVMTLKD